jgi:hypothetical protein
MLHRCGSSSLRDNANDWQLMALMRCHAICSAVLSIVIAVVIASARLLVVADPGRQGITVDVPGPS